MEIQSAKEKAKLGEELFKVNQAKLGYEKELNNQLAIFEDNKKVIVDLTSKNGKFSF